VLILPMLLRSFRPPRPENRICWVGTLMVTIHLFMHCNHLRSPGLCKVFELPAFELFSRAIAVRILVLGPRERPWRVRPVRASVVEKLRAAWVR
jgi:hypothetical protein